jgi:hypothetical protein
LLNGWVAKLPESDRAEAITRFQKGTTCGTRRLLRSSPSRRMKVEEIAKLPPDQLARFRRWFTAFDAGRADTPRSLTPLRPNLAAPPARAFAELKKRANEL